MELWVISILCGRAAHVRTWDGLRAGTERPSSDVRRCSRDASCLIQNGLIRLWNNNGMDDPIDKLIFSDYLKMPMVWTTDAAAAAAAATNGSQRPTLVQVTNIMNDHWNSECSCGNWCCYLSSSSCSSCCWCPCCCRCRCLQQLLLFILMLPLLPAVPAVVVAAAAAAAAAAVADDDGTDGPIWTERKRDAFDSSPRPNGAI